MPAETQAAGPGKWQQLDAARESLVARGMLRESGQRVALADPGLEDWVQTRVGQSAAHAGVALPGTPAPAISQPTATPGVTSTGGRHRQTANTATRRVGNTTFTINS